MRVDGGRLDRHPKVLSILLGGVQQSLGLCLFVIEVLRGIFQRCLIWDGYDMDRVHQPPVLFGDCTRQCDQISLVLGIGQRDEHTELSTVRLNAGRRGNY